MWQQRIILVLIRAFCQPSDSLDAKRKQCVLAAVVLGLLVILCLGNIPTLVLGGFFVAFHIHAAFVIMPMVLFLLRWQRHGRWARLLLFPFLVFYGAYAIATNGSFAHRSILMMIGLLTPLLSLFMCDTKHEVTFWVMLTILAHAAVLALQVGHLLPPQSKTDDMLEWVNMIHGMSLAAVYFVLVWFLIHVYTIELETRRLMQKDLEIFTRLSHEIRTPVTIITGLAELIQDWALPLDQKTSLSDLATAARRLNNVVNDFLTITSENGDFLDENSPGTTKTAFNVREVMDTVIGYHLPQAEKAGLNLYIDMSSDLPLDVIGPRNGLVCVLDHLISNAVKFTPSGSILLQVKMEQNESPSLANPSAEFHFAVQDTGVGLELANSADIFLPFTQSGDVKHFDGVGLGLAIAERTANRWGRSISVVSRGLGLGSTFSFAIPLHVAVASVASTRISCQVLTSEVGLVDLTGVEALVNPLPTDTVNASSLYRLPTTPSFSEEPRALSSRPEEPPVTILLLDDDPLSAHNIAESCTTLGLGVNPLCYGAVTDLDLFSELVQAIIFVVPVGPASVVTATQQTISEYLERLRHSASSASGVANIPDCFVVAPLALHGWCRDTLKIGALRRPPPFGQLRNVLKYLLSTGKSQKANANSSQTSQGSSSLTSSIPAQHNAPTPTNRVKTLVADTEARPEGHEAGETPTPEVATPSSSVSNPLSAPSASATRITSSNPMDSSGSSDSSRGSSRVPPSIFHPQWHHRHHRKSQQQHQQHEASSSSASSASPSPSSPSPGRILCVDDSPVILRILTNLIRKAGFAGPIDTAENGPEALRMVREAPTFSTYLLIFMDYHMPGGLTGAEVTTQIRALGGEVGEKVNDSRHPLAVVPIIGLTAAPHMREVCLSAGMTDVLLKPFTGQMIEDVLKTHL